MDPRNLSCSEMGQLVSQWQQPLPGIEPVEDAMKIKIEFRADNAAFEDSGFGSEVRHVLKQAQDQLLGCLAGQWEGVTEFDIGKLRDSNGNTVGTITVTE